MTLNTREIVFQRDNYRCAICDQRANQIAHLIANTKTNRKIYTSEVIDHPINLKLACSLEHNAKLNIAHKKLLADNLAAIIRENTENIYLKIKIENNEIVIDI